MPFNNPIKNAAPESQRSAPRTAGKDPAPPINTTADAQETAKWIPEADRKKWEDHLCPVRNEKLRKKPSISVDTSRFDQYGYRKLPMTFYTALPDNYSKRQHQINVAIWVPKNIPKGKCPVLVKFHGGGLIFGDCDEESSFAHHLLELAARNNAIIVAPNHRLMPEANGKEINDDINVFWDWLDRCLTKYLVTHKVEARPDHGRLLISGESSGAILAMHSWLHISELHIKAIYLQYPLLHQYKRECPEGKFNIGGVEIDVKEMSENMKSYKEELDKLKKAERCPVRSASLPPEGALMNNYLPICDRWKEAYNCVSVAERIISKGETPYTWPQICIFHGTVDERIPPEQNLDVLKAIRSNWGGQMKDKLHFAKALSVMHGKDKHLKISDAKFLETFAWRIEVEWGLPNRAEEAKKQLARLEATQVMT